VRQFWGLFRFTLGESVRQGTVIFYFAVTTLILLFCALAISRTPEGISIVGNVVPDPGNGSLNLAQAILYALYQQSVFWVIVFGIFGTAGLVPSMLDRPLLLLGRALGASFGISANIFYALFGFFLIWGIKLGFWYAPLLIAGFLLTVIFIVYFSIVALIGLLSRNSGFTIMASLSYIMISWGLESRVHGLYRLWENRVYHRILDGLYYILPQIGGMLDNSSRFVGGSAMRPIPAAFTPEPFLWSIASATLLYFIAIRKFSRTDY
jgi:hypothetical protein